MPTPLAQKIKSIIRLNGPLSVTDYFSLCLADPEHGYYRIREPFGRSGDFVTAPEISQLFGEMIGIFLVNAWERHGSPAPVILAEIGPGRGTMMADILRVIERVSPGLTNSALCISSRPASGCRRYRARRLSSTSRRSPGIRASTRCRRAFLLLVANELFDAVPIRQFVKTPQGFRERLVGLDAEDHLTFVPGIATIDPDLLPVPAQSVPPGTVFEVAPARDAVMAALCQRIASHDGTALIIDYGHMATGFGDTLQAIRDHTYDPPLANPGLADLTSHVDFEQLARRAKAEGLKVNGLAHQGDFLLALGIAERAGALGSGKDLETQEEIRTAWNAWPGVVKAAWASFSRFWPSATPTSASPPSRNESGPVAMTERTGRRWTRLQR